MNEVRAIKEKVDRIERRLNDVDYKLSQLKGDYH